VLIGFLKLNLDANVLYVFLTVSLDHAISWAEEEQRVQAQLKRNYYVNITTINPRKKKKTECGYLTPLNIDTNKTKKVLSFQKIWNQIYRL
jgi:hypothetical protein